MNNVRNEAMTETGRGSTRGSGWVAAAVGALGGVLLLGTVATAAVAGVVAANYDSEEKSQRLTESADGISRIDVDVSAARFTVGCNTALALDADGRAIEGDDQSFFLATSGGSREWRMVRHGDTLKVEPVNRWFGGLVPFGLGEQRAQDVSLLLPESACDGSNPLDADLDLGAGNLQVDGTFGLLDLSIGAGNARVEGTALNLELDVSAGEAVLDMLDVRTADLSVSAGKLRGEFAGAAPKQIDIEVSAGGSELTLPDEVYAVRSDVSAGDFENSLRTDKSVTDHEIDVELSAGSLSLRPSR